MPKDLSAACAFESGHLALLIGAGEGEVVSKEVGEEERGTREGVDGRIDNATAGATGAPEADGVTRGSASGTSAAECRCS